MADYFKRRDIQELLKNKKILFLGDSNVRPLYKDLIYAIKHGGLISVETLKNPNVDSYYGDIAIQQCGRKHEWSFWENRLFQEGPWRLEMFCTGGVMLREVYEFLSRLPENVSSVPDIVYISYNFSYCKNARDVIPILLSKIVKHVPCNTLVIVGSSFYTVKDMFGDPRFDEVPFFTTSSPSRDCSAEEEIINASSSLGILHLNIAHYLRSNAFRGVSTEAGWESVIVRYTTFLLLTCISNSLMVKTPNRVNQTTLRKAWLSANDERKIYDNLLLRQATNWVGVKMHSTSQDYDSVAGNAHEITQMLWKVYERCSSKVVEPDKRRKTSGGSDKSDKSGVSSVTATSESRSRIQNRELSSDTIETSKESPRQHCQEGNYEIPQKATPQGYRENNPSHNGKSVTAEERSEESFVATENSGRIEKTDYHEHQNYNDDEESMEEGEIRESPCGSPRLPPSDQDESNITIISDISSSESDDDAIDCGSATPRIAVAHEQQSSYYSSMIYGYYHGPSQSVSHVLQPSQQSERTHLCEPVVASVIDISDEEPIPEPPNEECNTGYEAIINMNSDESENDSLSPNTHDSRPHVRCPSPKKAKQRKFMNGQKERLCLMKSGIQISWPTRIARSGADALWKWWRFHIQGNNGVVTLVHPKMDLVRGAIPSRQFKSGPGIAVPKIIDDIHAFLECLSKVRFPTDCSELNVNNRQNDVCRNSTKETTNPPRLPSLAEELTRGSIKKIQFEIGKKSTASVAGKLMIKEFASIRHFLNNKSFDKLDSSRSFEGNLSTPRFYSYGEHSTALSSSGKTQAQKWAMHLNVSEGLVGTGRQPDDTISLGEYPTRWENSSKSS